VFGSSVTLTEDVMTFDALLTAVNFGSSVTLSENVMRFDALLTTLGL